MEVILRDHVDNLGQPRRGGEGRRRLRPELPVAAEAGAGRRPTATGSGSSASARSPKRARPKSAAAEALAARLAALELTIARRVGENEHAVRLGDQGGHRRRAGRARASRSIARKIQLPEPIKALGEFTVPVKLYRDVTAQLKVHVVKRSMPDHGRVTECSEEHGDARQSVLRFVSKQDLRASLCALA